MRNGKQWRVMIASTFQAADRALQMLECFDGEGTSLGVSELASRIGIHKSTASRLAATLEKRGFLERLPGQRALRLGPQMGRLGLFALGSRNLLNIAQRVMETLAAQTGETINLATLDGPYVVNVLQVNGKHLIGVGTWTGRRTPVHCVANGKVLLAFGGGPVPRPPLERFTPRTITTVKALEREIQRVRRVGWARNVGELEAGLHAVAAPVFDALNRCRAALSVSGPSFRLPAPKLTDAARQCLAAAREIERGLGRMR